MLAGVKVLPTQHPEWGLDHFVLVVGHGDQGLLVNTTWGDRRWVRDTDTPGADMTATREELEAELTIPASEGSWFQCVKR